jgi:carboxyl-terminal processing protease
MVNFLLALFPFFLGALAMYAWDEYRYRDLRELEQAITINTVSGPDPLTPPPAEEQAVRGFETALAHLNAQSYYRPLDQQGLWHGATAGLLKAVGDPYTSFHTPAETRALEAGLTGRLEGVGVYLERLVDAVLVMDFVPGSPAAGSGLQRRDALTHVDGVAVAPLSLTDILARVRGPAGTPVRLTLVRGDRPFDVTLVRTPLTVPNCTSTLRMDGIAVIKCLTFGETLAADFDAELRPALDGGARGLVLDLRNNVGGLTRPAQELIGRFVPASSGPAYYRARSPDDPNPEALPILDPAPAAPRWHDGPVAVLVNSETASTSEIVAGALQDYGRARLIGTHTYGKGAEQLYYKLDDGSSVYITYTHWFTPRGADINRPRVVPDTHPTWGLPIDIEVQRTEEDFLNDRDPQLDRAVQYLLTGK